MANADHSPTVIDEIQRDHRSIEELLGRVADRNEPDRAGAFDELTDLITRHEAAEQAVVHSEMRDISGAVAEEREDEEAEGDQLLDRLRAMDVDDPAFNDLFTQFREAVLAHAKREESEEHPKLERAVEPERLVQMGEEFDEAERDAESS